MSDNEIKEYNNIIRQMLHHEDEIRNQRTNWFLVIQGLLINGLLLVITSEDFNYKLCAVSFLLFIGMLVSGSFLYAAKLSAKASSEGKIFWQNVIVNNKRNIDDFPPICLLSNEKFKNNKYVKNPKNIFLPCIFLPRLFLAIEALLLIILLLYRILKLYCLI